MDSELSKTFERSGNSKDLSKTPFDEKENSTHRKEEDCETLQQERKTEMQQKPEAPGRVSLSREEVAEAGSTTEESLDCDRYASFLQRLEQKYKIERKTEVRSKDTRGTQTQDTAPQVLKAFYDENKCDLIFQIHINGEVVEMSRLELLVKDPKLILYFYEKHIEFTNPFDEESLILDKI